MNENLLVGLVCLALVPLIALRIVLLAPIVQSLPARKWFPA